MEMSRSSDFGIRTRRLRKVFSGKVAVRHLTLDVPRGEVFGFLGPNGAGKSTSVKMLLGLVFPTSGEAEILGHPAGDVKTRSRVGLLPEHYRFYDWPPPAELLKLHGRLYGMSHSVLRERVPALLGLVGLTPHRDKRLRDFSKGMLQRIGGATVLLNSHLLGEVEITCDRVAFIREGEVVETRQLDGECEEQTTVSIRAVNVTAEVVNGLSQWTSLVRSEGERLTID